MQRPRIGTARDESRQLGLAGPLDSSKPDSSMISNDKNIMPSMVVKQQRGHLTRPHQFHQNQQQQQQQVSDYTSSGTSGDEPYQNSSSKLDDILSRTREASTELANRPGGNCPVFDQDGLVLPRRVPHHHQQQGGDGLQPTTIRDLNRELKFNQVRGLCLLDQKSELKKAMEKIENSRRKKEAEQERLTRRTSLELRLEERAQRIARDSGETPAAAESARLLS